MYKSQESQGRCDAKSVHSSGKGTQLDYRYEPRPLSVLFPAPWALKAKIALEALREQASGHIPRRIPWLSTKPARSRMGKDAHIASRRFLFLS